MKLVPSSLPQKLVSANKVVLKENCIDYVINGVKTALSSALMFSQTFPIWAHCF